MATIFMILLIFLVFFLLSRAFSATRRLPLPPGTMGWPYFGETFQLYSKNPHAFFTLKQRRLVCHSAPIFLHLFDIGC